MIDKSSLLKSQESLYLEFIPKDGLFHKMLGETGAHWDTGYSGTIDIFEILRKRMPLRPYQINVIQTLLLSASCHEGIFTAVNLV